MANLLTTLINTAGAMQVFTRSLNVIQNNVTNANTPGYAKQTQTLEALPFDMVSANGGGVGGGPILSSRNEYDEQTVRSQQSSLGEWQQKANDLGSLQPLFSLTSTSGIASSLTGLFNSFSELSVNPNDASSRQAVINQAGALAQSFNETVSGIQSASGGVRQQTSDTVTNINQVTADLA
ncbi:MAG: FlgK family flagellar hook-associated protein, partial [Bryobacteraceae bacterium]